MKAARAAALAGVLLLLAGQAAAEDILQCSRGETALQSGDAAEAVARYTRCLERGELSPGNRRAAYVNRAIANYNQGELDAALADFGRAVALDPENVDVRLYRGQVLALAGRRQAAIRDYDVVIKHRPGERDLYLTRGLLRDEVGDADGAIDDFGAAIGIGPDSAEAYNDRGNAWRHQGNFIRALADYDAAIRLQPKTALFYANRARAYDEIGKQDLAEKDVRAARALGPDDPTVVTTLLEAGLTRKYGERR